MAVRRFLALCIVSFLVTSTLFGQSGASYFCTNEGASLEYFRTKANGDVEWFHTMKIGEVSANGPDTLVHYTSHMLNHKGKPVYGDTPVALTAEVDSCGVTLNVSESVAAVIRTMLPKNSKIVAEGGFSFLPSAIAPGDTLPDVYSYVKVFGMGMRVTVYDRQVLRNETIITPAGTFDCVVVRETKLEKGLGRNRHTTADTWYAPGIGMVRHDTHDLDLRLLTSEVLTAIR
ncbi:MAG: hypothetical protein J6U88_01525 [Bacteroidales bacterium]|nr:hypothetical protein [Bacteroidales bacterium]